MRTSVALGPTNITTESELGTAEVADIHLTPGSRRLTDGAAAAAAAAQHACDFRSGRDTTAFAVRSIVPCMSSALAGQGVLKTKVCGSESH